MKHHLPRGWPLEDEYLSLLDELDWLLDRADQGRKRVYPDLWLYHVRLFLRRAQIDQATFDRLLSEQGTPKGMIQSLDTLLYKDEGWGGGGGMGCRRQDDANRIDLATWTRDQRDGLRAWVEFARGIQIVALEAETVTDPNWYSYDPAGSLVGETVQMAGGDPTRYSYQNNEASHLASVATPSGVESYAYDHLNRRVVKEGLERRVYHYDLFGNLIGESLPDGTFIRDWVYVGNQRLAMIVGPGFAGGGGTGCGGVSTPSCALNGAADGGAGFLGLMGLVFLGIGVVYKRKKYTVAGLTFIGGVLFLVMMPEARSQTPAEQIYYYHNDHLGTPKVLTDSTGAVVWDVDYAPFGEISTYVTNTLPTDQPFRFPGQYADQLTGLYYNWNRYYDSKLNRYQSIDLANLASLQLDKGRMKTRLSKILLYESIKYYPLLGHKYLYSLNNPIHYMDPFGEAISVGITVTGTYAIPGLGGITLGWNYQQGFDISGQYTYTGVSEGGSFGASVEFDLAWGEGSWDGSFATMQGNLGPVNATYFQDSWTGVSVGPGLGAPIGLFSTLERWLQLPPPTQDNNPPPGKKCVK